MIDQKRIKEIRARCENATPGPWVDNACHTSKDCWCRSIDAPGDAYVCNEGCVTREDAPFIAHARQDVPDLLDALEEAQAENERLRQALAKAERHALRPHTSGQDMSGEWHESRICAVCGELFRALGGEWVGKHGDRCVFAKGGDNS